MAKFQQIYNADGSYEERLTLAGKDYVFRRAPYVAGIAKGLDQDITDQVEADYPGLSFLEKLLDNIEDMTAGFSDAQDVVPWLTGVEKDLEKERT